MVLLIKLMRKKPNFLPQIEGTEEELFSRKLTKFKNVFTSCKDCKIKKGRRRFNKKITKYNTAITVKKINFFIN
jgi:hypothetical protein